MKKQLLLTELLERFSENEIESFAHFLSCSHFNTDEHLSKLLDILKRKVLWRKSIDNEKQLIICWQAIVALPLKDPTLNKQQIALLRVKMSALTRLAEQFLTIEALQNDEACKNELLHRKLLEKKQFRLLDRRMNKFQKAPDEQIKDIPHYHYQYKTETSILNYLYHSGQWIKADNLPELNQNLDVYYLLNKLKLHITALSFMEASAQKKYDFSDVEALQHLLKLVKHANVPLLQAYRAVIDLMNDKTPHTYKKLLFLLEEYEGDISMNDLNDFYVVATNFCVHQIKSGKSEYHARLFDLYQTMDAKNLLLEGNLIPIGKLKNIVSVSCRAGKFEWATQMINKYRPFLRKENREHVHSFNLGAIAFYQKDYQTAIDYLHRIGNINLIYDISRRVMVVKSHYEIETHYKETTAQVFRSMEKYIKRNKSLPPKDKTAYRNFIRILINLYRIRHGLTKMSLERIKYKLEHQALNSDKQWLLNKIQVLEK